MFKKLFASMGIGSAEVDTRLHSDRVQPGQQISGVVHIKGGEVEQDIDGLQLTLMTEVEVESGDSEFKTQWPIVKLPLARGFKLRKHEQVEIPFQMLIHPETPLTEIPTYVSQGAKGQAYQYQGRRHGGNRTKVWIHTGLEIEKGLDARDNDYLTVVPTEPMAAFLTAMEKVGFRFHSADVEKGSLRGDGFVSTIGCYQEIQYVPAWGGQFRINEIELSFVQRTHDTGILIEIDRKGAFGTSHDSFRCLLVKHAEARGIDWESQVRRLLGV